MHQVQRKTRERNGNSACECGQPGARLPAVDGEIARHREVLSSVLRKPVLQRAFARIAKEYVPVAPSSADELAQLIDHTLLDPVAQPDEIARVCREAAQWRFATVCVNSRFVSLAVDLLENSGVGVCASIAFPFGAMSTEAKVCEAQSVVWDGATEVDVVLSLGLLKAQRYREVFADILYVRQAVEQPVRLRVVLEASLLTTDEMIDGALIAVAAGADFVKTSTGFAASSASPEDVRLLREVLGGSMGIKVSGNIHTWDGAREFLSAGASRIGSTRGVDIMARFLDSRRLAAQQIDAYRGRNTSTIEKEPLLTH